MTDIFYLQRFGSIESSDTDCEQVGQAFWSSVCYIKVNTFIEDITQNLLVNLFAWYYTTRKSI